MLDTFHFLRPEWLITLPFIALLLLLLNRRKKQDSGWEAVCDAPLLQFQLAQQGQSTKKSLALLHWTIPLLMLLSIIALAGPTWEKKPQPVLQQGNALVIILDLSLSMNAKDIKPSRIERAKLKLIDILQQKKEGQTALIAYAGDAHTVSPLTIDNNTIMSLLPALESSIMPLSGSHIIDAMTTAKELFKNAGFTQGDILLITDGIDPSQQSRLENSVKKLRQQGYRLSIIGIGSQTGSPIPLPAQGGFVKDQSGQVVLSKLIPEPLITLAELGNGQYHKLSLDNSDFNAILAHNRLSDNTTPEQQEQLEQWLDAGVYLTLVLIPLALLNFRKGLLTIMFVLFLSPCFITESVYANESSDKQWVGAFNPQLRTTWNNLWSTPNQQGQKAFSAQNYQQAADKFSNNNWKASALYRAGNFDQALEQYSKSDDAASLYNKGNTLANMQKFQEAADAYEQAIKKMPEFDNARKNLDYMKELIAQQKKQQEEKNSDKAQDESDKQSENQQQEQNNSTDDASKGNESDSKDSEQKNSDESDSEGAQSGKKDEQSSDSKTQEQEQQNQDNGSDTNEPEPREAKSPEDYQPKQAQDAQPDIPPNQQAQSKPVEETENNDHQGLDEKQNDILSQLNQEEQQSLKQWLQRIPDNPGRLLKIKFRNNTLLKQRQADAETQYEGNPW